MKHCFFKGFSLIEFLVVILISGLTIVALFEMLNRGFEHYNYINESNIKRSIRSNLHIWLREQICSMPKSETVYPKITIKEVEKIAGLKNNEFINKLKFIPQSGNRAYFINVSICFDKNKNKKAEDDECEDMQFFFRRRT